MDVGATLRNARTRKHLSLEQLAQSTKISASTLEALENNDFDRLPAAIYTRGFLRAYAREVDLDPEETVEQYLEQFAEAPPMVMAPPGRMPARDIAHDQSEPLSEPRGLVLKLPRVPLPALAAAVVVVAVGAYFAFALRHGGQPSPVAAAEAASSDAVKASDAQNVPDAARASNTIADTLRIELKTTGPCWVSATADRSPVLARLLQAGESQAIDAKEEFVLRVGDPSTISVTINGAPARPLGKAGQPVTVEINRQNYREYLSSGA